MNQVRLNVENQECDRGDVRVPLYVLFNKNYICILRKNSNPEYWVLEKTRFLEGIETPAYLFKKLNKLRLSEFLSLF